MRRRKVFIGGCGETGVTLRRWLERLLRKYGRTIDYSEAGYGIDAYIGSPPSRCGALLLSGVIAVIQPSRIPGDKIDAPDAAKPAEWVAGWARICGRRPCGPCSGG